MLTSRISKALLIPLHFPLSEDSHDTTFNCIDHHTIDFSQIHHYLNGPVFLFQIIA